MIEVFEAMQRFSYNANDKTFVEIFGEELGQHLWMKFRGYHFDVIHFYSSLDESNKIKLANYFKTITLDDILIEMELYRLKLQTEPPPCVDHVVRMCQAIVAEYAGYKERIEWSSKIRENQEASKCPTN